MDTVVRRVEMPRVSEAATQVFGRHESICPSAQEPSSFLSRTTGETELLKDLSGAWRQASAVSSHNVKYIFEHLLQARGEVMSLVRRSCSSLLVIARLMFLSGDL